jgi:hypothetical protein
MPDVNQTGETNISSGGDTTIGGDVVGGDKITTTTTNIANTAGDSVAGDKITQTVTNVEGGPTTRLAIGGVIGIAVIAILVLAAIIFGGQAAAKPTSTPSATPSATALVPSSTSPIVAVTDTPLPIPATTEPPSPTPTVTLTSSPTPTTETPVPPTPSDTPFPTNTPTLTLTPSPTSALGVYDDFDDRCLDEARWQFKAPSVGEGTPTPTPVPSVSGCLDTQREFLTEDGAGHLTVFVTLEGDVSESLVQKSNGCYREVEVQFALHDAIVFDEEARAVYLSAGLSLSRVSGEYFVEVRLEADSASGRDSSGRLRPRINARLSLLNSGGPTTLGTLPYQFDQPVTVAFRVNDRNQLITYVDGQPIGPPLSVLSDPCGLTLAYHADTFTLLDGYFDEARLEPLP